MICCIVICLILSLTYSHFPTDVSFPLRRFRHGLIAWPVILCWIPDHAKVVSSGTFAKCLCVWCVPLTSAKCQFPWRSEGLFCVSLMHPPDWATNHWLYQCSQWYMMCKVCHCPAVNLLCQFLAVFKEVIQTANAFLFVETCYLLIFSTISFQYVQVM